MQAKTEFIGDDYSAVFTQIGLHDESELSELGQCNDENISIELDALQCLRYFPQATNIILRPGCINTENLDLLYNLSLKRLKLDYFSDCIDDYTIDLGRFTRLKYVFSRSSYNFQNIDKCLSLKKLTVQTWCSYDLKALGNSNLEKLKILSGKLKSIDGICGLSYLKYLAISYQRSLKDFSEMIHNPNLEYLEIESCGSLNLYQIPSMCHLKYLVIAGSQVIKNCSFFERFPQLEYLVLGVKILDGDISPLLKLKHCALLSDCRHYSHKNLDLPKDWPTIQDKRQGTVLREPF